MTFTVWIARPKESNSTTIQKVKALGVNYLNIPLLVLQKRQLDINYDAFGIIIITSMHAAACLIGHPTTAKIAVVGRKSAAILDKNGIIAWRIYENIAALIVDINTWPEDSVLYLRGQHIAHNLRPFIRGEYSEHIAYSMVSAIISSIEVSAIKKANCVLVYSKRSGLMIAKTLKHYNIDASHMNFICISKQAAHHLQGLNLSIAAHPNEEAMMQILQTIISDRKCISL